MYSVLGMPSLVMQSFLLERTGSRFERDLMLEAFELPRGRDRGSPLDRPMTGPSGTESVDARLAVSQSVPVESVLGPGLEMCQLWSRLPVTLCLRTIDSGISVRLFPSWLFT
jgi:hypothetical protein